MTEEGRINTILAGVENNESLYVLSEKTGVWPVHVLSYIEDLVNENILSEEVLERYAEERIEHRRLQKNNYEKKKREEERKRSIEADQLIVEDLIVQNKSLTEIAEVLNKRKNYLITCLETYCHQGSLVVTEDVLNSLVNNPEEFSRGVLKNMKEKQEFLEDLVSKNYSLKDMALKTRLKMRTLIKYLNYYSRNGSIFLDDKTMQRYESQYNNILKGKNSASKRRTPPIRRSKEAIGDVPATGVKDIEYIITQEAGNILSRELMSAEDFAKSLFEKGLVKEGVLTFATVVMTSRKILQKLSPQKVKRCKKGRFYFFMKRD
ncbi:MAG: hypothetical protein JW791_03485 [Nanoarchaeota archaeon]|nr:hypothetical protein [Nanoarchaeota archaeon]